MALSVSVHALSGHGILLTRPAHQVSGLAAAFTTLGAQVVCHPAIDIMSIQSDNARLCMQLREIDWVIVTSQNAVYFLEESVIKTLQKQLQLGKLQLFAVGKSTATALLAKGLSVTAYPEAQPGTESLYHYLKKQIEHQPNNSLRILLLGGQNMRPWLSQQLQSDGIQVTEWHLYRRLSPRVVDRKVWQAWESAGIDTLVFTSGEALQNSLKILCLAHRWIQQCAFVVVSERIAKLADELADSQAIILARSAYDDDIVEAVVNYWHTK